MNVTGQQKRDLRVHQYVRDIILLSFHCRWQSLLHYLFLTLQRLKIERYL